MAHLTRHAKENSEISSEEEQERVHFQRIVNAFRFYRTHSIKKILLSEKHYNELPNHHKELIPHFRDNLRKMHSCVAHNYDVIKLIISHTDHMFENKDHGPQTDGVSHPASEFDMDKVKGTLKQVVRDWSSDGAAERQQCYQPVIDQITDLFPESEFDCTQVQVLVPGAGLGRLAFEIARKGFSCQGNEFSLFMLFASNFVLNKCKEPNVCTLYPWVHGFSNNQTTEDQVRPITFPDISPCDLHPGSEFSMSAGDFLEVYTEPDNWDCVATVFFIDTAHNIISYIETIWHILKPGGYWINLGPLLYHFADMSNETSIELSYEEVKKVIKKLNFEIVKENTNVPACYTQNPTSMLQYQYKCAFFVARKPVNANVR